MYDIIKGIPEDKSGLGLVTYALCSDGVYLIRASGCGHIVTKVEGITGLPVGKNSVTTLPRKIPISLFWDTVKFFRHVEEHHKGEKLEAYVLVMYNPATSRFFLHVPEQKVGAASAAYDLKDLWTKYPGCKLVMDIHSHTSSMGAFFSSTDDKDDNRDRYSGVIGKINQVIPDFKVRFSTLGKHFDFTLDDLFCESGETVSVLNYDECMKNIIVARAHPVGITTNRSWGSGWYGAGGTRSGSVGIPRSGYQGLWNKVRDRVMGDTCD